MMWASFNEIDLRSTCRPTTAADDGANAASSFSLSTSIVDSLLKRLLCAFGLADADGASGRLKARQCSFIEFGVVATAEKFMVAEDNGVRDENGVVAAAIIAGDFTNSGVLEATAKAAAAAASEPLTPRFASFWLRNRRSAGRREADVEDGDDLMAPLMMLLKCNGKCTTSSSISSISNSSI